MTVDDKLISDVWEAASALHSDMQNRFHYYEGKHSFLRKEFNNDGTRKNNVPVNWCKYIVDMHAAASTSIPIQYLARNDEQDTSAFEALDDIIEWNDLKTVDCEHFSTALVAGYSVELHSFSDGRINITQYDPREWAFIFNENHEIEVAIHRAALPKNSIYQGTLLTEDFDLFTVYTNYQISEYLSHPGLKKLTLQSTQYHFYGQVPVVLFAISEKRKPFLADSITGQNDIFNKIMNARTDEIEFNVDAFLKIQGIDPRDPDLISKLKKMRQERTIVLPDKNSDFGFVTKANETEKYREALDDSREVLLNQAAVPDIKEMFGASGGVSGIALRFKFLPMIQQAGFFWRYFEKSLRARIDLINRIWLLQERPQLLDYKVVFNFNLPIDIAAERSSLKDLKDIVSHRTLLAIHPEIDNPEEELEQIQAEKAGAIATNPSAESPQQSFTQSRPVIEDPEERRKEKEKAVEDAASRVERRLKEEFLDVLSATIPEAILNSGELERFLKKNREAA